MATSGDTDFALTARDIVTAALDENAILASGEDPSADEMEKCILRLNAMLKSWQLKGVTWKQETITLACDANDATTALPEYARDVSGARFVQSATNERMLGRWERDDYRSLPNKASAGTPTIYTIDRSTTGSTITVWPVPNVAYSLKLDIDRKMDTVTNEAQAVDMPEELTETVYANLAVRCCTIFQVDPSQELAIRAQLLEREMLDSYRPASYMIGPF